MVFGERNTEHSVEDKTSAVEYSLHQTQQTPEYVVFEDTAARVPDPGAGKLNELDRQLDLWLLEPTGDEGPGNDPKFVDDAVMNLVSDDPASPERQRGAWSQEPAPAHADAGIGKVETPNDRSNNLHPARPSSKEFPRILSESRDLLAALAHTMDSRVWGRIRTGLVPSAWAVQRGWALRTGAAAAISMAFALTCALYPAQTSRWESIDAFAPVIAISVIQVRVSPIMLSLVLLMFCWI